ncbi:transposase [Streptomyces sp. NPDC050388]|uniref:transposase n=1 Tax=Streptomyces sp. NPDC050388 TaxID=3155781 RepID=UPI0034175701
MSPRWDSDPDVRTGRHVVHNLHVHLVFTTKHRRKAFTDTRPTHTEKTMQEIRAGFEAEPKQFNAKPEAATGHPLIPVKQHIENQQRPA